MKLPNGFGSVYKLSGNRRSPYAAEVTLRKLKVLLGLMYKYAIIHEIIPKERNMVEYLNIKDAENPRRSDRRQGFPVL